MGRKEVENWNFFVFHPIWLKFGKGSNFEMLITKRRPKLKLEMISAKQLQLSTDFSQNYTMHSSTIALPWQQWMCHGLVCIQNESLLVYSKSLKKFEFPTAYRFSTAEGIASLQADSAPLGLIKCYASFI